MLMAQPWEPGTFWNVNLPHLEPGQPDPEIVFCPLDPSPLPLAIGSMGTVCLRRQLPVARSPARGSTSTSVSAEDIVA